MMKDFSKMVLIGNRILVKAPDKNEDTTKHGIILPADHEQERKVEGIIVMIGDGVSPEQGQKYKIGAKVIFSRFFRPEEVTIDEAKYQVLKVGTEDKQPDIIFIWND